jgi:WXG100 protein secretion system (Wss), protein YukD
MLASTLLVTLHSPLKTLDMELPGDIAVGELLPLLLEICGGEQHDPRALSQLNARLQVADTYTSLPLERTLIDTGICNGMVLVLQTQGGHQHSQWLNTTKESKTPPHGFAPISVQPGVETGGVGVTWEPLL